MSVDLPKGWQEARFGKLAKEVRTRGLGNGPYPVLSVTKHRGFVRSSEYFTKTIHSADTEQYKLVRKGQFAYATIHLDEGSIDLLQKFEAGLISPMYTVFEVQPGVLDPFFALRSLKRLALSGRFAPYSNGGVNRRRSIAFRDLAAYKYQYPPYPEQLAIGEVLRSVEDVMARKLELISSLGETKKAVMRELLTKGTRRDSAALKPLPERWVLGRIAEGVDQIPKDWKLVRLTSVAKLESGHTPNRDKPEYWGGTIPWLSLGDTDALDQLTIENTLEQVTEKGIKNSSARVLPVDTVIFSRTATVGKACRLAVEMATSQDFANWVCGSELDPRYLVQVFRHMKREWDRLQAGSTHQTIYMPTFKRLQILLPPKEEQKKIADTGEAFDRRIEAEKQSLAELQNTRAALAQELLSGRLRLPASMIARFENAPPLGKTSKAVTA